MKNREVPETARWSPEFLEEIQAGVAAYHAGRVTPWTTVERELSINDSQRGDSMK